MDIVRQVTVTCLSCQRRFSFMVDPARRREVEMLDDYGQPLGRKRILPRSFAVPCPYCNVENMVSMH